MLQVKGDEVWVPLFSACLEPPMTSQLLPSFRMFPVLHGKGPGLSLFIPTIYRDYCQGKRIAWDFDVFIEQVAFIVVINAVPVVQLLCHAGENRITFVRGMELGNGIC